MGNDPFSDARSGFVKLDDMLGRLLLIVPKSIEMRASTLAGNQGKQYESITADVIILDGAITDMIDEIPFTLDDTFVAGGVLVPQLKPKIRTGGMVLGRLGEQPSKTNPKVMAWVLREPTEEDKVLARPAASAYLADRDPFASSV